MVAGGLTVGVSGTVCTDGVLYHGPCCDEPIAAEEDFWVHERVVRGWFFMQLTDWLDRFGHND